MWLPCSRDCGVGSAQHCSTRSNEATINRVDRKGPIAEWGSPHVGAKTLVPLLPHKSQLAEHLVLLLSSLTYMVSADHSYKLQTRKLIQLAGSILPSTITNVKSFYYSVGSIPGAVASNQGTAASAT